jgi:uncharacterized protein YndB with AHSA1/START domain
MPTPYKISVSQQINAPMAKVFAIINDLNQFAGWNPFLPMDPNVKAVVGPITSGEGAQYNYESKKIGTGRMTFTGVYDNSLIKIKMEFLKPNQEVAHNEWRLTHVGDGVEMTWLMEGERKPLMALMVKVMGMDKMMSKHFADGLLRLKALAEA